MKEDRLRSPRDERHPRSEKRSEELTHKLKRVQESSRELCGRFPFTAKTDVMLHFELFFALFSVLFLGCFVVRFWMAKRMPKRSFLEAFRE